MSPKEELAIIIWATKQRIVKCSQKIESSGPDEDCDFSNIEQELSELKKYMDKYKETP